MSVAKNSAQSFNGEILHANAVRLRVIGTGDLLQELHSLDDVNSQTLAALAMATATNREPTTLANFKDQRIQYEFRTEDFGAYFEINKIIIFIRPVETGYPQ